MTFAVGCLLLTDLDEPQAGRAQGSASAAYVYPALVFGRAVNMSSASDRPFLLGDDLGIAGQSAASLTFHLDLTATPAYILIETNAVWFGGTGFLKGGQSFGGDFFPAGSSISSTGYGLWIDISAPFRGAFRWASGYLDIGPSVDIFESELFLPRDSIHLFYAFEGMRATARWAACRGITIGLDLGAWVGGRSDAMNKVLNAISPLAYAGAPYVSAVVLLPIISSFSEVSWTWMASVWAELDLDSFGWNLRTNTTVRVGWYSRGIFGGNIRPDFGGEGMDLMYGGPMVALEIRF